MAQQNLRAVREAPTSRRIERMAADLERISPKGLDAQKSAIRALQKPDHRWRATSLRIWQRLDEIYRGAQQPLRYPELQQSGGARSGVPNTPTGVPSMPSAASSPEATATAGPRPLPPMEELVSIIAQATIAVLAAYGYTPSKQSKAEG